jgi:hypothetical protein
MVIQKLDLSEYQKKIVACQDIIQKALEEKFNEIVKYYTDHRRFHSQIGNEDFFGIIERILRENDKVSFKFSGIKLINEKRADRYVGSGSGTWSFNNEMTLEFELASFTEDCIVHLSQDDFYPQINTIMERFFRYEQDAIGLEKKNGSIRWL